MLGACLKRRLSANVVITGRFDLLPDELEGDPKLLCEDEIGVWPTAERRGDSASAGGLGDALTQ
jgi:hypothetical protein